MPYITPLNRVSYDTHIDSLAYALYDYGAQAGELNYVVTRLVREWLGPKPDYARYNAALGVLEAAKLELYRRMVAPYEDNKIAKNGDVY